MKRKTKLRLKKWTVGKVDRFSVWFLGPNSNEAFTPEEAVGYIKRKRRREYMSKVDEYMFDRWGLS